MYRMFNSFSAYSGGVLLMRSLLLPRMRMLNKEYMWEAELKYSRVLICLQLFSYALCLYFQ